MPTQFPKRCTCCPLVHTASSWALLPKVGEQIDDWEALELRNCSCRSTLAVIVAVFRVEVPA